MPDTASITLIKRFDYRDAPEEWSNTYHFSGSTPDEENDWRILALSIYETERTLFTARHKLVGAYGYAAGNENSVAQVDFTQGSVIEPPGTYTPPGTAYEWSGDQAGWIRALVGTSSTGKKVYIRKYFHGGSSWATDPDEMEPGLRDLYQAHCEQCVTDGWVGDRKWCGPQGAVATLPGHSRYVTTRTLKRRGRRP